MEEKLLLEYLSKSADNGDYDKNRLILEGERGLYKGRTLIAQEQKSRKVPAFLFFAKQQEESLYLLQINPKKDCFSFLHIFDEFSLENLPLNGKSYNWLYPSDYVRSVIASFTSKKSTRSDLENVLEGVTSLDIAEALSDRRIDYILNYKGTRWSLGNTILSRI